MLPGAFPHNKLFDIHEYQMQQSLGNSLARKQLYVNARNILKNLTNL